MEEPSETTRSVLPSSQLEPHWVVGFVDGEGCFHIGISQHSEMRSGVQVLPEFTVVQHQRDIQLLYALKRFFGCGVVRVNHGDRMAFRVRKLEHLKERIVPFFEKYPLKSKKRIELLKFRKVLMLMDRGAHLRPDGLEQIKQVAGSMNRGVERYSPAPSETEETN